jgi:serine-type D-Ala-D-Ala carboxypeptidase/endopeptidase (penicillin-binding protein 4)
MKFATLLLISLNLFSAPLPQEIGRLLNSSPVAKNSFWGIQIVDLESGKTLYELNQTKFFVPASNAKLFSTSLALTRLGPDFKFQTRVLADAAPDAQGVIHGPVRLIGGGDPNLSARAIPYRKGPVTGNPLAALEELADQVVARGVKRIEGSVIGDDTWYVWEPYAEGWSIDDPQFDYGAPVSALTINDNTITLHVRPGANEGDLAALTLNPPINYYQIENRIRTVASGPERKILFERIPGEFALRLWGTIPLGDRGQSLSLGLEDPARYAANAFRLALEDRGVIVKGGVSVKHMFPGDIPNAAPDLISAPSPEEISGFELAHRDSAPLVEDLKITDKISQNLHAELALRAVARARRNIGSREAALEELKSFLAEAGINDHAYSLRDGSGLSRLDLVTPETVVKLLRRMYASPLRESWIELLPVGGEDGNLSSRFAGGPAAGRIHAKTGSVSHVNTLSGYVQRKSGDWAAFSILVNNSNGGANEVRSIIDKICTLIVE